MRECESKRRRVNGENRTKCKRFVRRMCNSLRVRQLQACSVTGTLLPAPEEGATLVRVGTALFAGV